MSEPVLFRAVVLSCCRAVLLSCVHAETWCPVLEPARSGEACSDGGALYAVCYVCCSIVACHRRDRQMEETKNIAIPGEVIVAGVVVMVVDSWCEEYVGVRDLC